MESKDGSGCSDFWGVNTLTPLTECRDNISAHLKRFRLPSEEDVLEYQLILTWAGHFCFREEKVGEMCARSIEVGWENSGTESICQHPEHKGKLKGVIGDRVFNVQLSRDVFEVFGIIIPIGSREYHFKSGRSFCLL